MEDSFKVVVTYKGKKEAFEAKLITYGYSYHFQVDIEGVTVLYEPDEERRYRARLDDEAIEKQFKPNVELVKLVGKKIEELF